MFHVDDRSRREIDRFVRDLRDVPDSLERAVRPRWLDTTADMVRDARAFAPEDSGRLKRSIDNGFDATGDPSLWVGTNYGLIHEFGGMHPVFGNRNVMVHQRASHFMQRAIERHDGQIVEDAGDAVSEAFRKAGFGYA